MELSIGQKVSYPNQGVCVVENIEKKYIGNLAIQFYSLRVLGDNSIIFVPTGKVENVGIRPILDNKQCKKLMNYIADDFTEVSNDWKVRSREFSEKLQSGNVFEAADVLKKLTFLSNEKKLSFREQTLLEKAKFLVISEITNAGLAVDAEEIENRVNNLLKKACHKHCSSQPKVLTATIH